MVGDHIVPYTSHSCTGFFCCNGCDCVMSISFYLQILVVF